MPALTPTQLVGKVAGQVIQAEIGCPDPDAGFAKLVMHQINPEDMLAIAKVVFEDPSLFAQVEIALPRHHFQHLGQLPDILLTTEPISELRNKKCQKSARLMALVDDSQTQSLHRTTKISRDTLLRKELAPIWLQEGIKLLNASLPDEGLIVLEAAFAGLFATDRAALRACANYIIEVIELAKTQPAKHALGAALWCLRAPNLRDAFATIKHTRPSEFQRAFLKHFRYDCYLAKRGLNQAPFTRQALLAMLRETESQLLPPVKDALATFIESGDGWTPASEHLAKLDWSEVRKFFEGSPKARGQTLGERTEQIFKQLDPDRFDKEDWDYVQDLKVRGTNAQRTETDVEFYHKHIREIQEDNALSAAWERFVYGGETRCTDFRLGLLECVHRLRKERPSLEGDTVIEVIGIESEKLKLRRKNPNACKYFETRYGHLQNSLTEVVRFRKCEVFQYSAINNEINDQERARSTESRKANQLSFRVRLASRKSDDSVSAEIRLVWEFLPQSALNGYVGDLSRLVKYSNYHESAPLISSLLDINPKSSRGGQYNFSLTDISSIQSPKRTELGALIPPAMSTASLADDWKVALQTARERGFIPEPSAKTLETLFAEFAAAYTKAIKALSTAALDSPAISLQCSRWALLLATVSREIKAESPRAQLLRPLLRVGITYIQQPEAGVSVAVVCPWHPLRLQSISAAEADYASHINQLVRDDHLTFSDHSGDLYLKDIRIRMASAGLPEVGIVWRGEDSLLLAQTDELADYSLLEPPISDPHSVAATNEHPARTASQISEIVTTYLHLQPHERDNFSIVLYNCDSKTLPLAVVESISSPEDSTTGETTCQVILTHQDRKVLAALYENIASQEGDDDAFCVSESSKDFMSRVRINISVDHAAPQNQDQAHLTDIVFCQDVISRHADLAREPVPRTLTVLPEDLTLHHWSRKQQLIVGGPNSVVYLTSPAQTKAGWDYLHALAVLKDRDYAERVWEDNCCLLPARKLNFDKPETTQIFSDTHALGNWVVNFDELLDRRILKHREVNVIRYRQSSPGGRNLVISSKANDTLLRATLHQKLSSLVPPDMDRASLDRLVTKFIDQANNISGNLVLRAARRGANANELLGLVLSHHLVRTEFPPEQPILSFLLDDYAAWLGQTEERVADLILLVPAEDTRGKTLDIVVTEAKFVRYDQAQGAAKESGRQLRDSLELLERAFLSDPPCIDQELWLARVSDLLLEGIQNLGHNIDIPGWRRAIRERAFRINLRGQSHVFIHGPAEMENDGQKFTGVKGCTGQQEIFNRHSVRTIISAFNEESETANLINLRAALSGMLPGPKSYRAVPQPTAVCRQPSKAKASTPEPSKDLPEPTTTKDSPALPPAASTATPSQLLPARGALASSTDQSTAEQEWVESTTQKLRHALLKREFSADLLQAKATPNALLLHFKGSDRLTVELLEPRTGELRTTEGLDIISVRGGLGFVIVMIARPDRKKLSLSETWATWHPNAAAGNTDILIAVRENDNEPLYLSPYPQPHTLIAGTTGSGKSVLIQNIILAVAATNTPEQAELLIIDPKHGLDYFAFEKLPHMARNIVTEPDDALAAINDLVTEMEKRLRLFRENRVQNIDEYIRKGKGVLPRLWVIHDEFGDWTQNKEYSDQATSLVNRLGQMARAAGIYLIFAAQRPDNTIFPMILRSNLGNRLVLKVDSAGTSEIATGIKNAGAEMLLGKGHLLALTGGEPRPVYAQVPHIDDTEVEHIVATINQKYPR